MRIRTIKPEFFTHDRLFEAEVEHKLPLRIAFAGLWCAADREGRFKWEPRRLGVQILPYDKLDFSRVLHALATRGFVMKYATETGEFGWIPGFSRHQIVNNKERASELPEPILDKDSNACPTRDPRDAHACHKERKGKEHGKEGNMEGKECGEATPPTHIAKASTQEEVEAFAISIGCAPGQGTAAFWKWQGNGWQNAGKTIKDWKATVRSWHTMGYAPFTKPASAASIENQYGPLQPDKWKLKA
jgi:hypothetical protein